MTTDVRITFNYKDGGQNTFLFFGTPIAQLHRMAEAIRGGDVNSIVVEGGVSSSDVRNYEMVPWPRK